MRKGIFITGTSTDEGKTYVSALLLKKLRDMGINAGYFKPALSGAYIDESGSTIAGDAEYVLRKSNIKDNPNDSVSYIFKTPVSPHLASQIEDKRIELSVILRDYKKQSEKYDFIVAEGCGGIVCPLNIDANLMLSDVIKALGLDIIIVSPSGLGSLNSIALTATYAKQLNINIVGVILNRFEEGNFLHEDNKNIIENYFKIPVIACVNEDDDELRIKTELSE